MKSYTGMERRSSVAARWVLLVGIVAGCWGRSVVGGAAADASDDVLIDATLDVSAQTDATDAADVPDAPEAPFRCGRSDQCAIGQYCTADGACSPGCRDDNACATATDAGATAAGGRCDTAAHVCVECTADDHCPIGSLCVGHVCALGCSATRACPGATTCCAGACVDTLSNPARCGACDRACSVPNAAPACREGVCAVGACSGPFANCDGDTANGCEVDTRTDATSCGGCGTRCEFAHATAACAEGMCALGTCLTGFGDCDGVGANGCETDFSATVLHCGACGRGCLVPDHAAPTCTAGMCGFACLPNFADCDGLASNGCEVDTRTASAHCGMCGRMCAAPNGASACVAGLCAVTSCTGTFLNCDADASNGCEVDGRTADAHCGACGRACAGGTHCVAGLCTRPLVVTGCGISNGGTALDNRLTRACTITGGVGMLSGATGSRSLATTTLRQAVDAIPAGGRIVRAMLYRQTYDRTSSYLTGWRLGGRDLIPSTRRVAVTPTDRSPYEVTRADITAVMQDSLPGTAGVVSLTIEQNPVDSSGGFGWWLVYEAPSLPERTIVVYDGGHTDVVLLSGTFTLDGFTAGAGPVVADLHVHGGGDTTADPSSTATFTGSRGAVVANDVTDPAAGPYAGTQVFDVSTAIAPGDTRATVDFSLRNYSGVAFVVLDVNAPEATAPCAPACGVEEACVGGRCMPARGCAAGPRQGFTDVTRFPDVAACGGRLSYPDAITGAALACATGWRACSPADISRLGATVPDLLPPTSAGWIAYSDATTSYFSVFPATTCGGASLAVSNLQGTAACTPGGNYPEGWRLAVSRSSWAGSHRTTASCVEHAAHLCITAGGTVAPTRAFTLCCR